MIKKLYLTFVAAVALGLLLTSCQSLQPITVPTYPAALTSTPGEPVLTAQPDPVPTQEVSLSKVTVDFNITVDPPLVKKFGVMNSGLVPLSRYRRDVTLLKDISAESLRIDLGWGWNKANPTASWTREMITGTPDNLSYNFTEIDELANMLADQGVWPYWSYCYIPVPLQQKLGVWNNPPTDLAAWQEILKTFASHFLQQGLRVGYQEVYNEPDLFNVFFTGSREQYLEMYKAGTTGIRQGNPDAVVGGPALAYKKEWITPFLDYVEKQGLPLDFFSFHTIYPGSSALDWNTAFKRVESLRKYFEDRPRFYTTEWHMNEFHPYEAANTGPGGKADRFYAAATIFEDFHTFLNQTDLTLVNWAQAMSSIQGAGDVSMGLVTLDGKRRASYNAFEIYARMPVDRRQAMTNGPVGSLASSDGNRASVVVWNRSDEDTPLTVDLAHLPFKKGTIQVYRIDKDHASVPDNPANEQLQPVETQELKSATTHWTGLLLANSVVYLEVQNATAPVPTPTVPERKLVRLHHYYPNRGASAYADYDRRTWIARLGAGQEAQAYSLVAAEFQGLVPQITFALQFEGSPQKLDANSLAGIRIDYRVGNAFSQSVLFTAGIYDEKRSASMPWGTQLPADQVVAIPNPAQFAVDLSAYAPPGWDGRIIVSYFLQNTGANTFMKVSMAAK